NHLIFVEGNCWANNWDDLFPKWDDNIAYSFHKYWNKTDKNTIQKFLDFRDQYNVPVWMGESGENSNQWFYETIHMLEEQRVGWSWWPLKKIGSIVCPLTAIQTPEYDQLLESWKNGETPDPDFCYQTLMQIADNLKIENCLYHPDLIDAMFRQQSEATSIPFKKLVVPGVIHAVDFDMGRYDVAYHDADYMNDNNHGRWNRGHQYRNDGVDIEKCSDHSIFSNNYNVSWIEPGEWMVYTVEVKESGNYQITFRVANNEGGGQFHLEIDQKNVTGAVVVEAAGGDQQWKDVVVRNVPIKAGKHQLKFYAEQGGFKLNYFRFEKE
ncbi:MAG TPA: cellulase family glycosylhydrolase, partial [Sunxiuqinia sp.]|nr:cellulase family glycosylhydrolase [Sunxiuqinia sp.]